MTTLGKLEEVTDLRKIWEHEALNFTPWLAQEENIELLGDAIGIDITVDETESKVGDFNVDIFATEADTECKIIIENQLEETNHDHLGKLITYAAGKSASIIVWVVKHAREEHRAAIEWLNNHTDNELSFFLCEIKLYKIGNSNPAVKFEVIERPNNWVKTVKANENISPLHKKRLEYWDAFQDYAFTNAEFSKLFNRKTPSSFHCINYSIGSSACHIDISQIRTKNCLDAELYISNDKELFNNLFQHKEEIEQETGINFDWRNLPNRKACRIIISKTDVDFENSDKWQAQFDWIMDIMMTIKKTFPKYFN